MTVTRSVFLISILACAGCGGKRTDPATLPADPSAAVSAFLNAVKASDFVAMGDLWGSDRGPANGWMDRDELNMRLTVMQRVLAHERFTVEPGLQPGRSARERVLRVRLTRNRCTPVVPFTVREYQGRWIVSAIDLDAAGSPVRPCP